MALILFSTINNFLGGTFMGLMDAYMGFHWFRWKHGLVFAVISCGFILGGMFISKYGLGKNPLFAMFVANIVIWIISAFIPIQPSIVLLFSGLIYISVVPFIEAAEQTILQKVVPQERQGRMSSICSKRGAIRCASDDLLIGPIAETFSSCL